MLLSFGVVKNFEFVFEYELTKFIAGQIRMKVSMVTGANRGIGLELVRRLASLSSPDQNDVVIACSRSMSKELEELVQLPCVHHVTMDITSQESVDGAHEKISALLGDQGINLLVNNAAVLIQSECPTSTSTEDFSTSFDVNVVGTHRVTVKFSEFLFKAADQNSDVDIGCNRAFCLNVSSSVGSIENTTACWNSAYRVSKAALNMLTRTTAIEFLQKNVLCCAVHPGWVQTDMGGPNALISSSACVDDLMEVIENANKEHSGVLLRNKMQVMPF